MAPVLLIHYNNTDTNTLLQKDEDDVTTARAYAPYAVTGSTLRLDEANQILKEMKEEKEEEESKRSDSSSNNKFVETMGLHIAYLLLMHRDEAYNRDVVFSFFSSPLQYQIVDLHYQMPNKQP